ncbi:MAG: M67 family metallopeptidase [Cyanobacteria bacterium P01_C01_bin.70]
MSILVVAVSLILTPDHLAAMQAHATDIYPEECCGLLLGRYEPARDRAEVAIIQPVTNDWTAAVNPFAASDQIAGDVSKRNRYWIDPKILLTAQRTGRDRGWIILGVYHSHPDHAAVPSERDRQLAWSGYFYPILSVTAGQIVQISSWRLDEHGQFYEVPMLMTEER